MAARWILGQLCGYGPSAPLAPEAEVARLAGQAEREFGLTVERQG